MFQNEQVSHKAFSQKKKKERKEKWLMKFFFSENSKFVIYEFFPRSALSIDLENPEVERIRKEFEMYRLNKENEITNMQRKDKKYETENKRLRAELVVLQRTCNTLRQERDAAFEEKQQALARAAAFEQDRDKVQRVFKVCNLGTVCLRFDSYLQLHRGFRFVSLNVNKNGENLKVWELFSSHVDLSLVQATYYIIYVKSR